MSSVREENPLMGICRNQVADSFIDHGLLDLLRAGATSAWTRGRVEQDSITAVKKSGLLGLVVPREHNASGLDVPAANQVVERVATADPSVAVMLYLHTAVIARIVEFGGDKLQAWWLPRVTEDGWLACSAWSDPGSTTDKRTVSATQQGDLHRRSGRQVVLKEARPYAGLDTAGDDAVARLHREKAMLTRLTGLPVVPRLIDFRTYWEHHFLVEEFIEGATLARLLAPRNPLVHPAPSAADVTEYTRWALSLIDQIERGLDMLHGKGVVFGDLHPRNIRVRDDDSVVFVDFELASPVEQQARPALGAPGFHAPPTMSGFDIDRYALACLRLWFFLPLTPLIERDLGKAAHLGHAVADRFPVPDCYVEQVLDGLGLPATTPTGPVSTWWDGTPAWEPICAGITKAIINSASPSRSDRLFPGDVRQFLLGGAGFAYGAAGVLYALSASGCERSEEHEEWLLNAVREPDIEPRAGFYDGLSGIAYVLDHLGHQDAAIDTLDRARALTDTIGQINLFEGLAGIGLNLLHFASDASSELMADVFRLADRLASAITTYRAKPDAPLRAGLMQGFSGPALFFVRLYEHIGEQRCLDLAASALRHDLDRCMTGPDHTIQVDDTWRVLPYLDVGSVGIGLVLHEYLMNKADDQFLRMQAGIRLAAEAEFVAQSGLFNGRAGLIVYLAHLRDSAQDMSSALARHLRRLAWHALPRGDGIAFPGDQLVRLSMDLATGSSGVLLALRAALGCQEPVLPFLRSSGEAAASAADAKYLRSASGETNPTPHGRR
jgi:serine/threonine protein kinase